MKGYIIWVSKPNESKHVTYVAANSYKEALKVAGVKYLTGSGSNVKGVLMEYYPMYQTAFATLHGQITNISVPRKITEYDMFGRRIKRS